MEEIWKDIPQYPGYSASSEGHIRTPAGKVMRGTDEQGYRRMYIKPSGRMLYAHRLVLATFVGPRPPGGQCRHLNGKRSDNRVSNLRWGTPVENMQDRISHGNNPQLNKTHCGSCGNPFDRENTYHRKDRNGRECRYCNLQRNRLFRRRHR